jgi:hypothetical protein
MQLGVKVLLASIMYSLMALPNVVFVIGDELLP